MPVLSVVPSNAVVEGEIVKAPSSPSYLGDAAFAERNAELKRLCEAAGLRLPNTILPEGTSLIQVGEEAQRRLATEISALPDLATSLVALRARIKAEAPRDIADVPVQAIRMTPDAGGLYREGKESKSSNALAYTSAGFGQIAQFIKPSTVRNGFAENLLALPNDLRSTVFNYHANNSTRSDSVTIRTATELTKGRRVIRAVTSDRHSLETGDDSAIADLMTPNGNLLPELRGAKARITREWDRSEFEMIWPAMDRQLVVGDIALMGVRVVNSETKGHALKVEAFLLRVLCKNFTTAETSDDRSEEISLRHVGDLRFKLQDAFRRCIQRIEPFAVRFADAYKVSLPKTRGEVLAQVGKVMRLPESTLTLAAQFWDVDGAKSAGDTLAGLTNALTRASQEAPISVASDIERAAGKLIAQGFRAIAL